MNDLFTALAGGELALPGGRKSADSLPWNDHPAFAGVALKHLVTSADSGGRYSLHLVRLGPGASIGTHVHEQSWELHQVAGGSGTLDLDGAEVAYHPGVVASLPQNAPHAVHAGEDGLRLLAVFAPPLL